METDIAEYRKNLLIFILKAKLLQYKICIKYRKYEIFTVTSSLNHKRYDHRWPENYENRKLKITMTTILMSFSAIYHFECKWNIKAELYQCVICFKLITNCWKENALKWFVKQIIILIAKKLNWLNILIRENNCTKLHSILWRKL